MYNAIDTSTFLSNIRKLNSSLWMDMNHMARESSGWPTHGLYFHDKFIMAIPARWIPEYSIAGCDFTKMLWQGRQDLVREVLKTGYVPQPFREKILTRGYRVILNSLVLQGYLDRTETQELFKVTIEPNRKDMPREHIQMDL